MPGAINFYDEPHFRGDEVADETTADGDLPTEGDPERAAAKSRPERGFRRSGRVPHALRVLSELRLATRVGA